jgi:hypothetical protein
MKYTLINLDDRTSDKVYDDLGSIMSDCEIIDWDNELYEVRDENGAKYVPKEIPRKGFLSLFLGKVAGYEMVIEPNDVAN